MAAEHAYDLNYPYAYGNAAPQRAPQELPQQTPRQKPHLRRVPKRRSLRQIRRAQERVTNLKAAKLFVFMAAAIVLLGVWCNSYVAKTTSRDALNRANARLTEQKNIAEVLDKKKGALVTAENIDEIARALGLVKLQNGSDNYLNLSGENRVRAYQGKEPIGENYEP